MLASSCTLKSPRSLSAARADEASHWLAVTNAHAVLETPCALKPLGCRSAARANAANTGAPRWLTVAKAHAALARFYTL